MQHNKNNEFIQNSGYFDTKNGDEKIMDFFLSKLHNI